MRHTIRHCRRGISLLEIIFVVTILGALAVIVAPRMGHRAEEARRQSCFVNKGKIETECELWFRDNGSWPATNLSNIGSDTDYFPDGLPTCPVDASSYTIDASTGRVSGHTH